MLEIDGEFFKDIRETAKQDKAERIISFITDKAAELLNILAECEKDKLDIILFQFKIEYNVTLGALLTEPLFPYENGGMITCNNNNDIIAGLDNHISLEGDTHNIKVVLDADRITEGLKPCWKS